MMPMLMTMMMTTMMMSFETSPGADDGGLRGGGDDMRAADRVFLPPLPTGTTAKYKYRLTPFDKYIRLNHRNIVDKSRPIHLYGAAWYGWSKNLRNSAQMEKPQERFGVISRYLHKPLCDSFEILLDTLRQVFWLEVDSVWSV